MIKAQNNRQSVYCLIQKVKMHFFPNGGIWRTVYFIKGEFCASKMLLRHYFFPTRKFLGSKESLVCLLNNPKG